jgi:hypothetical protein
MSDNPAQVTPQPGATPQSKPPEPEKDTIETPGDLMNAVNDLLDESEINRGSDPKTLLYTGHYLGELAKRIYRMMKQEIQLDQERSRRSGDR